MIPEQLFISNQEWHFDDHSKQLHKYQLYVQYTTETIKCAQELYLKIDLVLG